MVIKHRFFLVLHVVRVSFSLHRNCVIPATSANGGNDAVLYRTHSNFYLTCLKLSANLTATVTTVTMTPSFLLPFPV